MLNRLTADVREMFQEQLTYRELLMQMTRRDLMLRYKQTIMGFGWAVFMPILNTLIFTVIFQRVAPLDTDLPYPIFSYTGLIAWNLTASSLRFAVSSLSANTNLVTKVYFPREIFPFSAVFVSLVDFAVASIILVGMMLYYRIAPGPALLFLPVVLIVQITFTAGVSLLLAMGNLFFRDIKYIFEVVLMLWMFASSVLYPISMVGGRLGLLLQFNPMTPIIEAYRSVILRNQLPAFGPFGAASFLAFLTLAVAWVWFHRAEFQFAESV
ncbi:MAG: ABC transporter permease [Vicinamibacterales bacterium]